MKTLLYVAWICLLLSSCDIVYAQTKIQATSAGVRRDVIVCTTDYLRFYEPLGLPSYPEDSLRNNGELMMHGDTVVVKTSGGIARLIFNNPLDMYALVGNGRAFVPRSITGLGLGTVTSVGLSLPTSVFSISGSPVTTTGTLSGAFISQTRYKVLAAPDTGNGVPYFRFLVANDLPFSRFTWDLSGGSATYDSLRFVQGTGTTLSQSGNALTIAVTKPNTYSNDSTAIYGILGGQSGVTMTADSNTIADLEESGWTVWKITAYVDGGTSAVIMVKKVSGSASSDLLNAANTVSAGSSTADATNLTTVQNGTIASPTRFILAVRTVTGAVKAVTAFIHLWKPK